MGSHNVWDHLQERNKKIVEVWNNGDLSAAMIVRALRAEYPALSRNAVIGVLHRLGLSGGQSPEKRAFTISQQKKETDQRRYSADPGKIENAKARLEKRIAAAAPLPDEPKPIGPIEDYPISGCQYMAGDVSVRGWQMCGHPVYKTGSPWCDWHYRVKIKPASAQKPVTIDFKPKKRSW